MNIGLCHLIYSQSDFTPGYLLKSKSDTIFGLLKDNSNFTNTKYCEFKKNERDSIRKFTSSQIMGYRFINGKNYISREIESNNEKKRMFVEYLVEGKVNLYYYQDNIGNHYLLEKTGIPLKEISRFDEFTQQNDSIFQRDALIKRGLVEYFLRECPQLFPEIERMKNCTHENLIALLRKYHQLTYPNEACILYTKAIPKSKIYLQPTFDISNALSIISLTSHTASSFNLYKTQTFGVLANFSMPVVNEKIYFRTGFIYSHVLADSLLSQSTYDLFKVPLLFQYMDDSKTFSPTYGFGLDIMSSSIIPFEVLPTINVGINLKISRMIYISLFTDVEVFSTFDGIQLDHSIKLGVGIKL